MFKLEEIEKNTKSKLKFIGEKRFIKGVSIDSRELKDDELFVPIVGENFDGHKFIEEAVQKNISSLVFEENRVFVTPALLKTTVKNLAENVFEKKFKTLVSEKSFNNDIGVPLTLLRLNKNYEFAITEIGMNNLKEIEYLSKIAKPDFALITNVGVAHIGKLKSYEKIIKAKSEIFTGLKKDGIAILNADDKSTPEIKKAIKQKIVTFGMSEDADVRADNIKILGIENSFRLKIKNQKINIKIKSAGHFMVINALAVATFAHLAGISLEDIKTGIESFKAKNQRMEILKNKAGVNIIDDTYNANPDSMQSAINTLKILKNNDTAFFIAGDMLEMGKFAESYHKEIGKKAGAINLKGIYATGDFAECVKEGAIEAGFKKENIFIGSKDDISKNIKPKLTKNAWVLVKGSRGMKMEEVVKKLFL